LDERKQESTWLQAKKEISLPTQTPEADYRI